MNNILKDDESKDDESKDDESKDDESKDDEILKRSPDSRYICYKDILGKGSYKIVYRAYDTKKGIEVAWNCVPVRHLSKDERCRIFHEIKLLQNLCAKNDHIINFYGYWMDKQSEEVVFITELALSGTLSEYIRKINNLNMRVIKNWCVQILSAINYLHQQRIAHRDLKCNNIFINSNTGHIMLGDFGLAKQCITNLHSLIGTPEYMAPEMFCETYNEKVDIYSFGLCLMEMVTKQIPYKGLGFAQIYRCVSEGQRPKQINFVKSERTKEVILWCIDQDPSKRPTAKELLDHDFFKIIIDPDDDDENLTTSKRGKLTKNKIEQKVECATCDNATNVTEPMDLDTMVEHNLKIFRNSKK